VKGTFVGDTSPTVCYAVSCAQVHGRGVEAYSEWRKYLRLADLRRRVLFAIGEFFLALRHWATAGTLLHLGACHVGCCLGKNGGSACMDGQMFLRAPNFLRS
jgi:hypothetical protein